MARLKRRNIGRGYSWGYITDPSGMNQRLAKERSDFVIAGANTFCRYGLVASKWDLVLLMSPTASAFKTAGEGCITYRVDIGQQASFFYHVTMSYDPKPFRLLQCSYRRVKADPKTDPGTIEGALATSLHRQSVTDRTEAEMTEIYEVFEAGKPIADEVFAVGKDVPPPPARGK